MAQQAEKNLEPMTKWTVKTENGIMKLKREASLLQVQVFNFQHENYALRSGQGASLAVGKQNTDVAVQNFDVIINSAQASIKQLVSEIFKSTDRISEIKDDEEGS
ncbi:Serologically defined colon cancer antigen 3 [Tupaia chinensis]|uniref:Endosome-associated-trafficking regulator 1 n=1 Tax=Tupaia chinensis TaxID=246437 RepID=L9KLX5_TUPCH|nr:Serologically defined colon cancer antigen 3 [Tupaia chinensis]